MEATTITYDEFKKMDIRLGTIKEVEPIEGTDKLLKCQIDFGELGIRQIISGIKEYYPEYQNLIGKQVLYVVNLEPREIKGHVSQGMLMAVGAGAPVFLVPETPVDAGSKVR
jgi:methionyl-tRNA synthetase